MKGREGQKMLAAVSFLVDIGRATFAFIVLALGFVQEARSAQAQDLTYCSKTQCVDGAVCREPTVPADAPDWQRRKILDSGGRCVLKGPSRSAPFASSRRRGRQALLGPKSGAVSTSCPCSGLRIPGPSAV